MASAQAVWGIDVGRCALKAIKLRSAGDGKVEIVAQDFVEHAKILSQPDADRLELIGQSLEKFLSRNDISKDGVAVSVPGQHTLARFTKLPPVQKKRIPDIVRYEADQQIPFDMDEVIWDYQTFQEEDSPDLEVGIFAMKRELIREHLLHFEQAAIEPVCVQSTPLAVYNAAHLDGLLGQKTTILLDIGAEGTDLIIATPEGLWTRAVPIGGNNFTEALVKSFKLSFTKAENLKRSAASSKYARQIFQAMRPVFADLVQELQRSLGYYSSMHRDAEFELAYGVGNAFQLPGLQKYLQQNLGLTVKPIDTFASVSNKEALKDGPLSEQLLAFGAAFGLAVQGLDLAKLTSNLLPVEIAKQIVWRKKKTAFAAAAACLVLAGGMVYFRQSSDFGALDNATKNGTPINPTSIEQASDIVEAGVFGSMSDWNKAQSIYNAINKMKQEVSRLAGKGKGSHNESAMLVGTLDHKVVIPKIFDVIHRAVPKLSGPVGEAKTQKEKLAAIEASGTPRDERREMYIYYLDMNYQVDVAYIDGAPWDIPSVGLDLPDPIEDYEGAQEIPGILVVLKMRSTHKDGHAFVRDEFISKLLELGHEPGLGFFIDRLQYDACGKWDPMAGRRRTGGPATRGGGVAVEEVFGNREVDPVTFERVDTDWDSKITFSIILGRDYPQPEEDGMVGE